MKFSTMEEVIKRANDTHYGLAAGILTNDINRALTFSQAVNAGSVWYAPFIIKAWEIIINILAILFRVNCFLHVTSQAPFGGFKQSGIGREM